VRRRLARLTLVAAVATTAGACGAAAPARPPAAVTATPSAPASAPSSPGGGDCRLAVAGQGPAAGHLVAGFIRFPPGTATMDPQGGVEPAGAHDPRSRTTAPPHLYGAADAWPSYDRPAGRWVPAPPQAVSPDGLRYAYAAPDGVHLVDVASAIDRVIQPAAQLDVLAVQPEGVYAVQRRAPAEPSEGLWLLGSGRGSMRQLRAPEPGVEWAAVGGGVAWASMEAPGGLAEMERLDLGDGSVAVRFRRAGAGLRLIGLDPGGRPLVEVATPAASTVWLVTGSGDARQVSAPTLGGDDTPGYTASASDAAATWFSDDGGHLYRFTAAAGVERMPDARLVATLQRVAGGCL
jgi:hypothetical protein